MADAARNQTRAVRIWLLCVAALIFATILVGGATRLTESGLSIVEWRPVTGTLPPTSEAQWEAEFEKYKTIPQAQTVNRGMTLAEFRTIYWWEWTHRLLGRLIGVVFLLPLLWFIVRGAIGPALRPRLWLIFGLGALQGAVGWWMVASGLSGRISVSPYRLAFHLTLACAIYAAIVWTARSLTPRTLDAAPSRLRHTALALLALTLVQIYLGALVAGLDAGLVSNTWPLIDGAFVPAADRLFFLQPAWRNIFENELTAQFNHRMVGYALWALALLHVADVWRTAKARAFRAEALALAVALTVQALLGIATIVHAVPLALALAHQAMAVIALTVAVLHAHRASARTVAGEARAAARGPAPEPIEAGE